MPCFKVALCGAPSSRKSTVCSAVESLLKQKSIIADTSREYARCYINRYGRATEAWEQLLILQRQTECNEATAAVSQVMLTDTPPFSCYRYALWSLQQDNAVLKLPNYTASQYRLLEELYIKSLKATLWFDSILVFPPTDPVVHDGTRNLSMEDKLTRHEALMGFLNLNNIPYTVVAGTTEDRINQVYSFIMEALHESTPDSSYARSC